MIHYCLRTNTKKEMLDALLEANILINVNTLYEQFNVPNQGYDIHTIGFIPITERIIGENGQILQEETYDERWHVNIRCYEDLTDEQKSILPIIDPQPTTPKAKFA